VQRFEFRLERVLKLKKQREWLAELRQMEARAALDAARAQVAVLHDQVAQSAAALQACVADALRDAAWLARHQQALRLGPLLELAEANARQADHKYQEASAARTQIATEVEALRHLRQQEWHAYRLALLRAQQEQLDEVGLRRWQARADGPGIPS
jgi:flagellar biosynthesis chaperone FliJ